MEARGQAEGVSSLLPLGRFLGSNSGLLLAPTLSKRWDCSPGQPQIQGDLLASASQESGYTHKPSIMVNSDL